MIDLHFNNLTYRTKNQWCSVDTQFQNGAASVFLSVLRWNTANPSLMIVCIQSPSRILIMPDQKSLTWLWLSSSGWGKKPVSLVFSYKGGRFIQKCHWCAKVNILQLTVGYLNATINRRTRNKYPEIRTDRSSQTRQHPRVDTYGSGYGLPIRCWLGFWTVLEPNRTVFPAGTQTAGMLSGPVAITLCTTRHPPANSGAILSQVGSITWPMQNITYNTGIKQDTSLTINCANQWPRTVFMYATGQTLINCTSALTTIGPQNLC